MQTIKTTTLRTVFCALLALALLGGADSQAQTAGGGMAQTATFNIAAGDLATALKAFGEQSDTDILFDPKLAASKVTAGLVGQHETREGLRILLAQANLSFRVVDGKTILIESAESSMQLAMPEQSSVSERKGTQTEADSAAGAGESSSKVQEIVVSAQRREQRLLETPISIGVLSGAQLDRSSSRSVADVLNQIGGISMIEREPGYTQISVRGVVPDQSLGTSTAGFYLDEVPFAFITKSHLPDTNAFDLARIEVLRGPQGTLYGANALSGVVRVLTNDASLNGFEVKGRVRTSDTSEGGNNYGGDFAVNVPLIPGELAVRAVASYSDLSGYINSSGDRRFNDTRAQAYRLKANYKPSDSFSIKLGLSRSQVDNGGPSYAFDNLTTPFSDDQADSRVNTVYNLIAEYQWPSVSLLSSTAYFDYDADTQTEIEAFPGFYLNFFNGSPLTSFSQELRFTSRLQGAWQWSAGAIYKDTTEKLIQKAPAFFSFPLIEDQQSDSYAVFGEMTRSLADGRFELAGGLRYYNEQTVATEISSFFGAPSTPRRTANFNRVTGRVVLAYKPQSNRTFYSSVATGFRAGLNQNSAVAGTNPEFGPVDPDHLINYEIGAKGSLFAGAVTFDTAIYFMDWKDIQQSLITNFGFVAGLNAGSASGVGVDGSITYSPNEALTLQATVGWSGLELDGDVPFGTPSVVLFKGGERVNLSPEWSGSVGGSYRFATSKEGMYAVLSSNFAYRSSVTLRYLASGTLVPSESNATRTLKASIGLQSDRWTVELFGDNLLDDRDGIMPPDLTFAGTSIRQRPRTIGLQSTFNY